MSKKQFNKAAFELTELIREATALDPELSETKTFDLILNSYAKLMVISLNRKEEDYDALFMGDWSIIEWGYSPKQAYYYALGLVDCYKNSK